MTGGGARGQVDEMIRMVDKDGDGAVSFDEFYEMVSGGKVPPPGLWDGTGGEGGVGAPSAGPPPTDASGAPVIQARQARKNALDEFAAQNSIKPESIKKAYQRFQETDVDHSGLIDYTEFCEVLQVEPSPQVEKLFQLFDNDKSGQIDVKEFMIGLSNFSGAGKEEKLKFAFMVFDEDGNGVITKQELLKILKARVLLCAVSGVRRAERGAQANHMASNDKEVARKADTIMMQADKDGDGVISFDEFVIVSKKFPNILFPAYSLGKLERLSVAPQFWCDCAHAQRRQTAAREDGCLMAATIPPTTGSPLPHYCFVWGSAHCNCTFRLCIFCSPNTLLHTTTAT